MEEVFEFNGQEYSLFEVEEAAKAKQISIDDYINQYNISRKPGKTTPTAPGAVVEETVAPESQATELASVNTFSELQQSEKDTAIERAFGKNEVTDFFGDLYRAGIAGALQAEAVDPSLNLFKQGADASEETINKYIETNQKIASKNMESDEMKSFNEIYDKEGGGWWGFVKGVANNPTTLPSMLVSSIATQIGSLQSGEVAAAGTAGLVTGAGAGAFAAGIGAIPGGIAGLMGGTMAAMETGLTFSELLAEEVGDDLTNESVKKVLGNPEKLAELKNKALGRGVAIGAIELATMGIAKGVGGKIAKAGFRGAPTLAATTAGGIEVIGGGTGEVAGRFVAGQEMDVAEIGFEAFAGLGSAPISMGGQLANLNTNIDRVKINKQLKNTSYKNIAEAFAPEAATTETEINIAKIKNSSKILDEQVNNLVKNTELTPEEGQVIKNNFRDTQGAVNRLSKLELIADNEIEAIALLKEEQTLKQKIKSVDQASLTTIEAERVTEINNRLKEIVTVDREKKLKENVAFTTKAGAVFGLKTEVIPSKKQFTKKFGKEAGEADGFIEKGIIYINEEVAKNTDAITVGSHELLHGILNIAFKSKDAGKLVNDFKNRLNESQLNAINERLFATDAKGKRLYSDEYLSANPDEYLTAFSDAIGKNEIAFEENVFTKIGDFITPILRKLGFAKIKFNTGKDVYNFLREYNKSIKEGKLSEDIASLADQPIETGKKFSKSDIKQSLDKLVQTPEGTKKYNTKEEFQTSEDYIKAYEAITQSNLLDGVIMQGMTEKGLSGQSMANFIDNVKDNLTERFVKNFDPAKNDSLFGWLLGKTPIVEKAKLDVIAAYVKKVDKESIEREVDGKVEARSIIDEGPSVEEIVDMSLEQTDRAPKSKLRRELKVDNKTGIDQALIDKIKTSVEETFKGELPNVKDKAFRKKLINQYRAKLKAPIAKLIGGGKKYKDFLIENKETLLNNLPISYLVQIERKIPENERIFSAPVKRLTTQKEIDKANQAGLLYVENEAVGPMLYKKLMPTDKEFLDFYGVSDDVNLGSTKGTRKDELARIIGVTMAVDMTPTVIREKAAEGKVTQQEQAKIAEKIQRDPTLKFSLTTKAEGEWVRDQLNPLDESRAVYKFKVGEINYEINTFKDPLNYNYNIFEQEEGIEEGAINDDPKSWGMTFASATTRKVGITEYALKGRTNQFKVFGTVANATIDLIKKEKLNSITFTAKEESRKRLYRSLNQKFASELGWKTYEYQATVPGGTETIFIAYNPEVFVTIADPNPAPIKYSYNLQNKNWPAQKKEIIRKGGIFQEFMGDIKTTLGSVRPSHVITSNLFEGKDKDAIEIEKNEIRDGIKAYKTKNKNSLLKEGDKYGTPQVIYGSSPEKIQENIDNGTILKNKNTFDRIFNDMWSRIYDMLETYPEMEDFIENFLKVSNNDVSHPQRLGAIFSGFDPKAKFNKDFFRRYEYEHAVQSHIVWKTLLNSAKINAAKKNKLQFTKDLFDIKQNYVMLAISIEDNNKVAKAGYAHKMPKNWKNWWNRYFNKDVAAINGGINPNKLTFIEYSDEKAIIKGTIAEEFNIKNSKGERTVKQFSKTLSQDFNKIIEDKTGIAADEVYKKAKAEVVGASKGKWKFFIPPGAEDFVGLLYATLGKGKLGDQQMAWYKYNLLNPYTDALNNITRDRVQLAKDFKELKKQLKIVPKNLRKKLPGTQYSQQDAVRVYIWNKQGVDMLTEENGMDKTDLDQLIEFVEKNPNLLKFADQLMEITQGEYASPGEKWWDAGSIDADLLKTLSTTRRTKYLEESGWTENVNAIFSKDNLNKLEAAYGKSYRIALENILKRMKSGRNRSFGGDALTSRFTDWISNSIGTIMFLNSRSAVLQTISAVNFINWSDNNVLAAAKAFANPKQWTKDFMMLMNSPFLVERRNGLKIDVNESEIADLANTSTNKAKAIMGQLLKAGFLPTQIADSFAIASGGASFYRNRINSLVKAGYTTAEAEKIAMRDFRETATESQQSSDPSRISQQQAGPLGRIVLAFANTPAQYARLTKKAVLDIKNGRGDLKTNVSKIIYYMVVQNIIFTALQQALFAVAFGDEDDEDEMNKKYFRMGNSMADSILRGLGFAGAAVSVAKNVAIKIAEESGKKAPKFDDAAWKLLEISPPISSKVSKFRSAGRTFSWNKKEIKKEGLSLDNPAAMAGAQIIAGATNLPVDRALRKIDNVQNALSEDAALWQRIALLAGWQDWELGMQDKKKRKKKKKTTTTKKSIR